MLYSSLCAHISRVQPVDDRARSKLSSVVNQSDGLKPSCARCQHRLTAPLADSQSRSDQTSARPSLTDAATTAEPSAPPIALPASALNPPCRSLSPYAVAPQPAIALHLSQQGFSPAAEPQNASSVRLDTRQRSMDALTQDAPTSATGDWPRSYSEGRPTSLPPLPGLSRPSYVSRTLESRLVGLTWAQGCATLNSPDGSLPLAAHAALPNRPPLGVDALSSVLPAVSSSHAQCSFTFLSTSFRIALCWQPIGTLRRQPRGARGTTAAHSYRSRWTSRHATCYSAVRSRASPWSRSAFAQFAIAFLISRTECIPSRLAGFLRCLLDHDQLRLHNNFQSSKCSILVTLPRIS